MDYNYNYSLGSIFFLGLTIVFYMKQKRIRDTQDSLYSLMLFAALAAVIFDFVAAAIEPVGLLLPLWLIYAVNTIFLLGMQICLPAFLLYTLAATEKYSRLTKIGRIYILIPFFVIVCLLVISHFSTAGIYFIDEQHIYRQGKTHWMLYAATGLYIASSYILLFLNYKNIPRGKLVIAFIFIALLFLGIILHIIYPSYLLTTASTALALTAMYYVLRAPGEQLDPFTGAFARTMLPSVLKNYADKKKNYTTVLISIINYEEAALAHGLQMSEKLLVAFADWLRKAFPKDIVIYMEAPEFTVILDHDLDDAHISALSQMMPSTLDVEGNHIPLRLAVAVLCQEDELLEDTLTTIEFLYRHMREERQEKIILADTESRKECNRLASMEASFERLLDEAVIELRLEPIRHTDVSLDSTPAYFDCSLALQHEKFGFISPDEFLYLLKHSGRITWYYRKMAELLGEKVDESDPEVKFCVPLVAAAFVIDDMEQKLENLIADSEALRKRIILSMSEKDAIDHLMAFSNEFQRLADLGFGFRLDGFASGYTDMSRITSMPFKVIMIDESLLMQARNNAQNQELLTRIIGIVSNYCKEVVCTGVDTAMDLAIARASGAPLIYGKWCSGPVTVCSVGALNECC